MDRLVHTLFSVGSTLPKRWQRDYWKTNQLYLR